MATSSPATAAAGTTVASPGVSAEIGDLFAGVAAAAPDTRTVSYASTSDRAFVSDDGRTTFGLIYPRYAGDGPSPDEPAVERALAGATVAGGEVRVASLDNTAAVQRAMETAGHAVLFSGTTVAISLLALVALPVAFLRSIGLGGLLIPLVSVAVTLTLLPVILASIGPRLDWPRLRSGDQTSHLWERWAAAIVRHRVVALLAGVALLALLLVPAFQLELASPASSAFASNDDTRVALNHAGMPPGLVTPFEVLINEGDPRAVADDLATINGVAGVVVPEDGWQRDGSSIVLVLPEADGSTSEGRATLEHVRDAARQHLGARVGGAFAGDTDFIDAVYGNIIPILAIILAITFVLLVRAFRSVVLPLKAVLLNCVSVAAAYGVLVLVWQHGYGSEQLWGIEATGAIPSWLPLMVFAFLFGLSMDYKVFILAHMREEYDKTGSTDAAVVRGMSHTARLVTTAAVILFLAFASLAAVPATDVKILATGLAAGILLDATIVRAVLVPAAVADRRPTVADITIVQQPGANPAVAAVAPARIRQVIDILLDNAIKYTPAGGTVTVDVGAGDPVEIVVADTGLGIPPEHLPHVFERFYRADAARSDGSAGLGLAIARQIVERHGGTIAVKSSEDGSTFIVRLPADAA
ncbi:MAG TPA: MMPL family transporter [Thermomicrobiales bacterium]|nr:MMPL family transporter [Thermomicrobiales bacterium]